MHARSVLVSCDLETAVRTLKQPYTARGLGLEESSFVQACADLFPRAKAALLAAAGQ